MGEEAIRQSKLNIDFVCSDILRVRALIDAEAYEDTIELLESSIRILQACKNMITDTIKELPKN